MPNGVKKSQKTAHAARVRAEKKQREADRQASLKAEAEGQIYKNTPLISPEHHEVMMKFARRLAGEVRGWESLIAIATEDAPKLVGEELNQVSSKRYATFVARNLKVICPILNQVVKAKKGVTLASHSFGGGKNFLKKLLKLPLENRIEAMEMGYGDNPNGSLWKALLGQAGLNLRFCGTQKKLYLCRETDALMPEGILEKFGTDDCDVAKIGKDVVDIIWKMVFDPPKIAKEENEGGAKWKIQVGCFGSMWIDVSIDRDGELWDYRMSITNTVYDSEIDLRNTRPTICGYSKKFNPHFIIRPRGSRAHAKTDALNLTLSTLLS